MSNDKKYACNDKKYAFFSQKAFHRGYGGSIWSNLEGKEVLATFIGDSPEIPESYKWDDTVPLGEVTTFVRSVKPDSEYGLYQRRFDLFTNNLHTK